jgi:hypothetical protein
MVEADKAKFKNMLDTVMAIYGKPSPDKDTLRVWWAKLSKYEFDIVTRAFNNYVDRYKIMPNIASILELCKVNPIGDYVPLPKFKSDPQKVEENRKKFKEFMHNFALSPKPEPKAWAKKIMENPGHYPEISVRYAREALNIKGEV